MSKGKRVFGDQEPLIEICPYAFSACKKPTLEACPLIATLMQISDPLLWKRKASEAKLCGYSGRELTVTQHEAHRIGEVVSTPW